MGSALSKKKNKDKKGKSGAKAGPAPQTAPPPLVPQPPPPVSRPSRSASKGSVPVPPRPSRSATEGPPPPPPSDAKGTSSSGSNGRDGNPHPSTHHRSRTQSKPTEGFATKGPPPPLPLPPDAKATGSSGSNGREGNSHHRSRASSKATEVNISPGELSRGASPSSNSGRDGNLHPPKHHRSRTSSKATELNMLSAPGESSRGANPSGNGSRDDGPRPPVHHRSRASSKATELDIPSAPGGSSRGVSPSGNSGRDGNLHPPRHHRSRASSKATELDISSVPGESSRGASPSGNSGRDDSPHPPSHRRSRASSKATELNIPSTPDEFSRVASPSGNSGRDGYLHPPSHHRSRTSSKATEVSVSLAQGKYSRDPGPSGNSGRDSSPHPPTHHRTRTSSRATEAPPLPTKDGLPELPPIPASIPTSTSRHRRSADEDLEQSRAVSKPSTSPDTAKTIVHNIGKLVKTLNIAPLPLLKSALKAIERSIGMVESTKENEESLKTFERQFREFYDVVLRPATQETPLPEYLHSQFDDLYRDLQVLFNSEDKKYKKSQISLALGRDGDVKFIRKLIAIISRAVDRFQNNGITSISSQSEDSDEGSDSLPTSSPATQISNLKDVPELPIESQALTSNDMGAPDVVTSDVPVVIVTQSEKNLPAEPDLHQVAGEAIDPSPSEVQSPLEAQPEVPEGLAAGASTVTEGVSQVEESLESVVEKSDETREPAEEQAKVLEDPAKPSEESGNVVTPPEEVTGENSEVLAGEVIVPADTIESVKGPAAPQTSDVQESLEISSEISNPNQDSEEVPPKPPSKSIPIEAQEPSSISGPPVPEKMSQAELKVGGHADPAWEGNAVVADAVELVESEKRQPSLPVPEPEVSSEIFNQAQQIDKDCPEVPEKPIPRDRQPRARKATLSSVPSRSRPRTTMLTEHGIDIQENSTKRGTIFVDDSVVSNKPQPLPPVPIPEVPVEIPRRKGSDSQPLPMPPPSSSDSAPAPNPPSKTKSSTGKRPKKSQRPPREASVIADADKPNESNKSQPPLPDSIARIHDASRARNSWVAPSAPSSPSPVFHALQSNDALPAAAAENSDPFQRTDKDLLGILDKLVPQRDPRQAKEFQDVVGTIVVLQDPLPLATLAKLLRLPEKKIQPLLKKLHAANILSTEPRGQNPISLYPSVSDFLTTRKRCTAERVHINPGRQHGQLTTLCLTQMASLLPKGENYAETSLLPNLRYCCLYWTSHLAKAPATDAKLCSTVSSFCKVQLSKWLVAVRVLGEFDVATESLEQVENYLTIQNPKDLKALVNIIRTNQQTLQSWQTTGVQPAAIKSPRNRNRPMSSAESDDENYDD